VCVCVYIYIYIYICTFVIVFEGAERLGGVISHFISEVVKLSHCLLATSSYHVSYLWVRDSSAGIANCYGLDGPGIESQWGRDFPHPSRPALGPTQLPINWVSALFSLGKAAGA